MDMGELLRTVKDKKLVFFGEIHEEKKAVALFYEVQRAMAGGLGSESKLHVVLEHFRYTGVVWCGRMGMCLRLCLCVCLCRYVLVFLFFFVSFPLIHYY
jgi:hypothetical protein